MAGGWALEAIGWQVRWRRVQRTGGWVAGAVAGSAGGTGREPGTLDGKGRWRRFSRHRSRKKRPGETVATVSRLEEWQVRGGSLDTAVGRGSRAGGWEVGGEGGGRG